MAEHRTFHERTMPPPRELEDLSLAAFFAVWSDFEAVVLEAFRTGRCWREQVRLGSLAAAEWLRDHPTEARFAFLEALRAGGRLQAERERRLERLVDLVDRGRLHMKDPLQHGREVAVAVVGGAVGLLVQGMERGWSTERVEAAVPEFMYMAVLPYLGEDAAHEELRLAVPAGRISGGDAGVQQ
jgi:hypothetical protein